MFFETLEGVKESPPPSFCSTTLEQELMDVCLGALGAADAEYEEWQGWSGGPYHVGQRRGDRRGGDGGG